MDDAVIAIVVAYFVAYAVLALGEALREYFNDENPRSRSTSWLEQRHGQGPGCAPGP